MTKDKTSVMEKISEHPGLATAAGAIIGAGVVAAASFALKNEKTREKAEKMFETVGEKAQEFAENMKEDAKIKLEEKTQEAVEDVKKVVEK